jgi:hypothetical protein
MSPEALQPKCGLLLFPQPAAYQAFFQREIVPVALVKTRAPHAPDTIVNEPPKCLQLLAK